MPIPSTKFRFKLTLTMENQTSPKNIEVVVGRRTPVPQQFFGPDFDPKDFESPPPSPFLYGKREKTAKDRRRSDTVPLDLSPPSKKPKIEEIDLTTPPSHPWDSQPAQSPGTSMLQNIFDEMKKTQRRLKNIEQNQYYDLERILADIKEMGMKTQKRIRELTGKNFGVIV